jgi:hypothetical protein
MQEMQRIQQVSLARHKVAAKQQQQQQAGQQAAN